MYVFSLIIIKVNFVYLAFHFNSQLDQACRGLFPLGFFLCNCVYWFYYMYMAEDSSSIGYSP